MTSSSSSITKNKSMLETDEEGRRLIKQEAVGVDLSDPNDQYLTTVVPDIPKQHSDPGARSYKGENIDNHPLTANLGESMSVTELYNSFQDHKEFSSPVRKGFSSQDRKGIFHSSLPSRASNQRTQAFRFKRSDDSVTSRGHYSYISGSEDSLSSDEDSPYTKDIHPQTIHSEFQDSFEEKCVPLSVINQPTSIVITSDDACVTTVKTADDIIEDRLLRVPLVSENYKKYLHDRYVQRQKYSGSSSSSSTDAYLRQLCTQVCNRSSSELKPFESTDCGQVFNSSDHLKTHTRPLTGEKPYRCPLCPYASCSCDNITRYLRTNTKRSAKRSRNLSVPERDPYIRNSSVSSTDTYTQDGLALGKLGRSFSGGSGENLDQDSVSSKVGSISRDDSGDMFSLSRGDSGECLPISRGHSGERLSVFCTESGERLSVSRGDSGERFSKSRGDSVERFSISRDNSSEHPFPIIRGRNVSRGASGERSISRGDSGEIGEIYDLRNLSNFIKSVDSEEGSRPLFRADSFAEDTIFGESLKYQESRSFVERWKPYCCKVCGKAFSSSDHLNIHKSKHTGPMDQIYDVSQQRSSLKNISINDAHDQYEENDEGNSRLHCACRNLQVKKEALHRLFREEDLGAYNKKGITPIQVAYDNNNETVLSFISQQTDERLSFRDKSQHCFAFKYFEYIMEVGVLPWHSCMGISGIVCLEPFEKSISPIYCIGETKQQTHSKIRIHLLFTHFLCDDPRYEYSIYTRKINSKTNTFYREGVSKSIKGMIHAVVDGPVLFLFTARPRQYEYHINVDHVTQTIPLRHTVNGTLEFPRGCLEGDHKINISIITFDDQVIEKRLNERKGNAGILAVTDLVYVHHNNDFILKECAKLTLSMRIKESGIHQSTCLIHHENDKFNTIALQETEIDIDSQKGVITVPVYSFTGAGIGQINDNTSQETQADELQYVYKKDTFKMCKILPMIKFEEEDELKLWVDCIPLDKVISIRDKQLKNGFAEIPDALSKDLQINDHDCWNIEVGGLFSLPDQFCDIVYQVHVQFIGDDNHSLVPIHIEFESGKKYGTAEFSRETTLKDNKWRTFANKLWLLQHQSEVNRPSSHLKYEPTKAWAMPTSNEQHTQRCFRKNTPNGVDVVGGNNHAQNEREKYLKSVSNPTNETTVLVNGAHATTFQSEVCQLENERNGTCQTDAETANTFDSDRRTNYHIENSDPIYDENKNKVLNCSLDRLDTLIGLNENNLTSETQTREQNGNICGANILRKGTDEKADSCIMPCGHILRENVLRDGKHSNLIKGSHLTFITNTVNHNYSEGNGCLSPFFDENVIDTRNKGILGTQNLAVLADNLNWEDAKTLCRVLGVKEDKIRDIDSDRTKSPDKIYRAIHMWKNSFNGDLETMEKDFIDSFKTIGRFDIVEKLRKACTENRTLQKGDF